MAELSHTVDESWSETTTTPAVANAGPLARLGAFLRGPWPTLVSRLVLGTIFLLAGLAKLGVPNALAASINSYEMPLPDVLVQVMSIMLPPLEIAVGVFLLIGLFTRLSGAAAAGLMVIFTVALIQAALRGIDADCGCFGGPSANPLGLSLIRALGPLGSWLINEKVGWQAVVRDLVFLGMAAHLMFVPSILSLDYWRARRRAAAWTDPAAEYEDGADGADAS